MPNPTTSNPAIARTMFSSATDDWPTPQATFDDLDAEFGFTLDACASTTNHKAPHYYALDHADAGHQVTASRVLALAAPAHALLLTPPAPMTRPRPTPTSPRSPWSPAHDVVERAPLAAFRAP